jgi:uncharacterized protein YbjT (DUF2867 family)
MRILLTGATGYIGRRLLALLLQEGHTVTCAVRNPARLALDDGLTSEERSRVQVVQADFDADSSAYPDPNEAPCGAAYYLLHGMDRFDGDFAERESAMAERFRRRAEALGVQHVVYLGGIANAEALSDHLASRRKVEEVLSEGAYRLTALRAGIIIGSGSASFEIIRDLVEKLPVMVAPRWLQTRCQPIGITDVMEALKGVLEREDLQGRTWDIGGPEVLTYKAMLQGYAAVRGLKRRIYTVPIMTPRLSSYWLYFVTATSYPLAVRLVDSMKVDVVARDGELLRRLGITPLSYREAVRRAFRRIAQDQVLSSWKDALSSSRSRDDLNRRARVPEHGCLVDERQEVLRDSPEAALQRIWSLGGSTGWYAQPLWQIRGYLDKLVGGIGLRRGRTSPTRLDPGDALDFWRVLVADREGGRLLLYAEMKVPGEAWLEFRIRPKGEGHVLEQKATFRPLGVWGRMYWYALVPLHAIVFGGMARKLAGA